MDHVQITLSYIRERQHLEDTISLDGQHLTIPKVLFLSLNEDAKVQFSESVLDEVKANSCYLKEKIEKGLVIYGVNTGFGGSADVRCKKHETVQRAAVTHHNVGMGRVFPSNHVRAAMVIRANSLAKGYSGVRTVILETLEKLINNAIVPQVPLRGSISASGDLMPLSYIASVMVGRDDLAVKKKGILMTCPEALKQAGIEPIGLEYKDGLGIINAVSFSAGVSASTLYDANLILLLTQVCTALAIEAQNGRTESFHPVIQTCLPHIGQAEIARNMLEVLSDSKLAVTDLEMHLPDKRGMLKQDRYSLRGSPQWLGSVAETLKEACRRLTIELNSANDNPLVDHRTDTIIHCANFLGETMSISMDQVRQAIGLCGKLMYAQFAEVVDNKLNYGLSPNLSGCDINQDFGFKGCDLAMTAYMSEMDHFVNPMSNHVLSAEMHNQSVNSMALVSARMTSEVVEIAQMMVTNLLCLTIQAIDLRYLMNLVMVEIDELVEKHPSLKHEVREIEWYNLMFSAEEKANELSVGKTNCEQKAIKEFIGKRLSDLYAKAVNGEIDPSILMAKGTRRIYNFVRKELSIPFYHGQCSIDRWLERILEAIQNRQIEDVLLDIFAGLEAGSNDCKQEGHITT